MLNLILILNIKLKFKIGDHVRISKYKNIFAKGYTPNQSEAFVISRMKNAVPWTYVISDLTVKKFFERFMKKNRRRQIQKNQNRESIQKKMKQAICQIERI